MIGGLTISRKKNCNEYTFLNDHVEFKIYSKKYGDFTVLIDKDDYTKIKEYNWLLNIKIRQNDKTVYTYSNSVGKLHRYIMNAPSDMIVDHMNGNTLDNRKINLRICTQCENAKNRKRNKNNITGYSGVRYSTLPNGDGRWEAYINIEQKQVYLGCFDNIGDAIALRKEAEKNIIKNLIEKI